MGLATTDGADTGTEMTDEEKHTTGGERLAEFLDQSPLFTRFRDGVDTSGYADVPDDWLIGTADVIGSTQAIELGNYKIVNMIGAGVIAAAMNQTGSREIPFVFGGDGAAFVVPPEWEPQAKHALSAMRRWASEESDLRLRAALVPVGNARTAGHEVRLARFSPSPNVDYAMFAGGGLAWAEREMKAGRYEVPRAAEGVRPDLEGLSCRWQPANAEQGEIVSLIVVPDENSALENVDGLTHFEVLERRVLECLSEMSNEGGHPLSRRNIRFALSKRSYDLEARTDSSRASHRWKRFKLRWFAVFAWSLFRFNLRFGRFDPTQYQADLLANTDFRKFDDGLKLTVNCSAEMIDRISTILNEAESVRIASYGMHRQNSALITCIVPSSTERDHLHFVDGAEGGYARAAENLKGRRTARELELASNEGEDRRRHSD